MQDSLDLLGEFLDNLSSLGLVEYRVLLNPHLPTQTCQRELHRLLRTFADKVHKTVPACNNDEDLIQIKTKDPGVLNSRIEAFIKRQQESHQAIQMDFTPEGGCSRTVPYRYRKVSVEQSATYVTSTEGQQASSSVEPRDSTASGHAGPEGQGTSGKRSGEFDANESLRKRLKNVEDQCVISGGSINGQCELPILERMKTIEDRLVYLESVSPEYSQIK